MNFSKREPPKPLKYGRCTSCRTRDGVQRTIRGMPTRPILCDVCVEKAARRTASTIAFNRLQVAAMRLNEDPRVKPRVDEVARKEMTISDLESEAVSTADRES